MSADSTGLTPAGTAGSISVALPDLVGSVVAAEPLSDTTPPGADGGSALSVEGIRAFLWDFLKMPIPEHMDAPSAIWGASVLAKIMIDKNA